jgi:hypothetical protein
VNYRAGRDFYLATSGYFHLAIDKLADINQPAMDSLARRCKGLPVSEIKPVLNQEMTRWGGSISDDATLTRIATAVSSRSMRTLYSSALTTRSTRQRDARHDLCQFPHSC